MKHHTKIYMQFFGYQIQSDCICEVEGCGLPADDVNHIKARGMGGNPNGDKDLIENLMGTCRNHHNMYGDVPEKMPFLVETHLRFMKQNGLKAKYLEYIRRISEPQLNK